MENESPNIIRYSSNTYAEWHTSEVLFDEMLDIFVNVYSDNKIVLSFIEKGVAKDLMNKDFIVQRIRQHSKQKIENLLNLLKKYNYKCNSFIKKMLLLEEISQG